MLGDGNGESRGRGAGTTAARSGSAPVPAYAAIRETVWPASIVKPDPLAITSARSPPSSTRSDRTRYQPTRRDGGGQAEDNGRAARRRRRGPWTCRSTTRRPVVRPAPARGCRRRRPRRRWPVRARVAPKALLDLHAVRAAPGEPVHDVRRVVAAERLVRLGRPHHDARTRGGRRDRVDDLLPQGCRRGAPTRIPDWSKPWKDTACRKPVDHPAEQREAPRVQVA